LDNKLNILLVEDEDPAAQRLRLMIHRQLALKHQVSRTSSVAESLEWLNKHPQPDLIFLDINLSDGSGFDLLSQSGVNSPVIFTTAYDEYALEAFKVHSIDYLLKPIREEELKRALDKFSKLRGQLPEPDYTDLLRKLVGAKPGKEFLKRIIIRIGSKLKTILSDEIAYIVSKQRVVNLVTFEGAHYALDETLDDLEGQLDPSRFFRINRSMIIQADSIQQMLIWTKSRLKLELKPPYDEDVLVSYEKAAEFRQWLTGKTK